MSDVPVFRSETEAVTAESAGVPAAPAGTAGGPGTTSPLLDPADAVTVTVRYFAAARAAAGVDDEPVTTAAPATVAAVVHGAVDRHGDALARVLARCSYLLNATAVHELSTPVQPGDQLDVLPPFAGG